jgi:hypothetical protein
MRLLRLPSPEMSGNAPGKVSGFVAVHPVASLS